MSRRPEPTIIDLLADPDELTPESERRPLGQADEMHAPLAGARGGRGEANAHGRGQAHPLEYFGPETRAVEISTRRIESYKKSRLDAGARPATINREVAALRRAFRLGQRVGKVVTVPYFGQLAEHNVRGGFFEWEELEAVCAELSEPIRPVVRFMYFTGWRRADVLRLTWPQVDFPAGTVRLEPGSTKNAEGRVFPFSVWPALGDLLREQRERTLAVERATGRIIPWVFHRHGEPILDYGTAWHNACARAGVADRLPAHDFRRTAVRNLERAGVPRSVAMKLTGHRTESVYRRYAVVNEADLSEGVAKLSRLHAAHLAAPPERRVLPLRAVSARGTK